MGIGAIHQAICDWIYEGAAENTAHESTAYSTNAGVMGESAQLSEAFGDIIGCDAPSSQPSASLPPGNFQVRHGVTE